MWATEFGQGGMIKNRTRMGRIHDGFLSKIASGRQDRMGLGRFAGWEVRRGKICVRNMIILCL
jgi:hypothetical protein